MPKKSKQKKKNKTNSYKKKTNFHHLSSWKDLNFKQFFPQESGFLSHVWILIASSIISFFLTLNSTSGEISHDDFLLTTKTVINVGLVQIAIILLFQLFIKLPGKQYISRFLLALFINVNFYSFHVVFIVDFSQLSDFLQIVIFLITLFITFQFLSSISEFKRWRALINVASVASVVVFSFQFYQSTDATRVTLPDDTKEIMSTKINMVDFVKKPNIYLLSFDALVPPSVQKSMMSIDPIKYKQVMQHHNFRIFKNGFSDGVKTTQSLNRLLALHPEYYDSLAEHDLEDALFTGILPAPLFEIFHKNGYNSTTYSKDTYFGKNLGPYTEHRIATRFTLCFNHLPRTAFNFGFFGYCHSLVKQWIEEFISTQKNTKNITEHEAHSIRENFEAQEDLTETIKYIHYNPQNYVDFIISDWHEKRKKGTPQVFFPYVISPIHITPDFDGTQTAMTRYRQRYFGLIDQETPALIHKMLTDIKKHDPRAIVFLFGDHGKMLTERLLPKIGGFMAADQKTKDISIWTQLAVVSAVHPPDVCPEYLSQDTGELMEQYALNSVVTRQLIHCLSGGKDPISGEIEYRIYDSKKKNQKSIYRDYMYPREKPGRYEDYLYEFPNRLTNISIPVLPE